MLFTLNAYNYTAPDAITPGLISRVQDSFAKAYLKDTAGSNPPISYGEWLNSPLSSGYNANLEFLKAMLTPSRGIKAGDASPSVELALDNATQDEIQAVWNFFIQRSVGNKPAPTSSESDSTTSSVAETPASP